MTVFEKITKSPETLAEFLRNIPAIETAWDAAFHDAYCGKCLHTDCEDCPHEENRNNPLWYLKQEAAG